MYAIVETGGKQYRVRPGDTIAVERLGGSPGETLDLERVLLLGGDGAETRVGSPGVAGAIVRAEVLDHALGEKIVVFRYKSKVRYRRKTGHRQKLTRLRIRDILLDGASTTSAVEETQPAPETGAPPEAIEAAAPHPRRRRSAPKVDVEEEMPPAAAEAGPTPEEGEH